MTNKLLYTATALILLSLYKWIGCWCFYFVVIPNICSIFVCVLLCMHIFFLTQIFFGLHFLVCFFPRSLIEQKIYFMIAPCKTVMSLQLWRKFHRVIQVRVSQSSHGLSLWALTGFCIHEEISIHPLQLPYRKSSKEKNLVQWGNFISFFFPQKLLNQLHHCSDWTVWSIIHTISFSP